MRIKSAIVHSSRVSQQLLESNNIPTHPSSCFIFLHQTSFTIPDLPGGNPGKVLSEHPSPSRMF
ncbi:hypothetical protein [Moorena sp. SIO3A5]|nr:hypothetical protein [Moorena sp. SIO3A5]